MSTLKCLVCQFECKNVTQQRSHMAEKHPDAKPFVCPTCSAGYKHKKDLRKHTLKKHRELASLAAVVPDRGDAPTAATFRTNVDLLRQHCSGARTFHEFRTAYMTHRTGDDESLSVGSADETLRVVKKFACTEDAWQDWS